MKIVADRTESSNYFILLKYQITFISAFLIKNATVSKTIKSLIFLKIMVILDIKPSGSLHLKHKPYPEDGGSRCLHNSTHVPNKMIRHGELHISHCKVCFRIFITCKL